MKMNLALITPPTTRRFCHVFSLALCASLVGASVSHKCPRQSVCNKHLCCKPDQYCGGNSLECESCFQLEATEEDNLKTCREMKNVSDIALKLRDPSCNVACLHRFGGKLYESSSKRAENRTVDGQLGSSDVKKPGVGMVTGNRQVGSSDEISPVATFFCGMIVVVFGLVFVLLWKRRHRRSRLKDEAYDVEKGSWERDQGPGPIDSQKESAICRYRTKSTHDADETERLVARSAGENDLQHHLSAHPTQSGATQEITGPEIAARESTQTESQAVQPVPADGIEPTARPEAQPLEPPRPGVQQTEGAAESRGKTLNPVTAPTDDTNSELHTSMSH